MRPKSRRDLQAQGKHKLRAFTQSLWFALLTDVVVVANALAVGWELDHGREDPDSYKIMRFVFCGIYVLEMGVRLLTEGEKFFKDIGNCFHLLIVVLALVDTFALDQAWWLWRSTVLRSVRILRIHRLAAKWRPLTDLWLVLMGLARAWRALAWFALLLLATLYACGGAATGLIDSGDGPPADREAFNDFEYFGSVPRSMLTLLQLATLDGWASHVVRPLFGSKPFVAAVLVVFSFITAYGFISVGVGVLVWSTVQLAHKHEGHASQLTLTRDLEIISTLTSYFRADLWASDREFLTKRDLQDAMALPQVADAFRQLDLPLPDIERLFDHIDQRQIGHITVEEFEKVVTNLKKPATRFDVACLTATLGGSATFVSRLESRSEEVLDKLDRVKRTMGSAFTELNVLAQPDQETGKVPEVMLRKAGRIYNVAPPAPPRYTG